MGDMTDRVAIAGVGTTGNLTPRECLRFLEKFFIRHTFDPHRIRRGRSSTDESSTRSSTRGFDIYCVSEIRAMFVAVHCKWLSTKMAESTLQDLLRGAAQFLPPDVTGRYLAIVKRVMSADWSDPDEMADVLLKELARYDLQHMYSRFMATCLLFWIAPEEMRKGNRYKLDEEHDEVFKKTEEYFSVMWIAYERWMARGFTHYVDVSSSLNKFYSELRWGANLQRRPEGFVSGIDEKIGQEAYFYLKEVRSLVKKSYADFETEIEPILAKLKPIDPESKRSD